MSNNLSEKQTTTNTKENLVYAGSTITYGLVVGLMMDYATGIRGNDLLVSRSYATTMNAASGPFYERWRNTLFRITKTTEKHGFWRKTLVDTLACGSFNIPFYSSVVAVTGLATEGSVDPEKLKRGALFAGAISPFIGPTIGLYANWFRSLFGVASPAEKSSRTIEDLLDN